jgi:hypothetical protein
MSSSFAAAGFLRHAFILASILALAGAAYSASRADDDADLSALLKRQTQAFSEAGQRGDAATINRYPRSSSLISKPQLRSHHSSN